MTQLCGLVVSIDDPSTAIKSDLFEIHARLRFAFAPREHVEIYSYRAGATDRRYADYAQMREGLKAEGVSATLLDRAFPAPPADDDRSIHLRGYVGEKGTLHDVAALALESLGGTLTRPMSDEQRHRASVPLTPTELRARRRRHNREWLRVVAGLPFHVVRAAFRRLLNVTRCP
jgi:hypothetical protein